jgi:hypothetical protein
VGGKESVPLREKFDSADSCTIKIRKIRRTGTDGAFLWLEEKSWLHQKEHLRAFPQ